MESRSTNRLVQWHEFESAEYLPLFSILRLRSAAIPELVVIFVPNEERAKDGSIGKGAFVRHLVETQMGRNFKKRWLP